MGSFPGNWNPTQNPSSIPFSCFPNRIEKKTVVDESGTPTQFWRFCVFQKKNPTVMWDKQNRAGILRHVPNKWTWQKDCFLLRERQRRTIETWMCFCGRVQRTCTAFNRPIMEDDLFFKRRASPIFISYTKEPQEKMKGKKAFIPTTWIFSVGNFYMLKLHPTHTEFCTRAVLENPAILE